MKKKQIVAFIITIISLCAMTSCSKDINNEAIELTPKQNNVESTDSNYVGYDYTEPIKFNKSPILTFPNEGGEDYITITNYENFMIWRFGKYDARYVTSDYSRYSDLVTSWFSICHTKNEMKGRSQIKIIVMPNNSDESREDTVQIQCLDTYETIIIHQQ